MKSYWVISDLTKRWFSANMLSESYLARYKRELDLVSIKLNQLTDVEAGALIIFGDIHYDSAILKEVILDIPLSCHILFHLYGDSFTRLKFFEAHNDLLTGRKIKFVVGSKTSLAICQKIFADKNSVCYAPFFVDYLKNDSLKKNKETRKKVKKICYFGRISYFKNVHILIDLFRIFSRSHPEYELHIAGGIDNYRWKNNPSGSYFNYAGEVFSDALRDAQNEGAKVFYHGELSREKVSDFLMEMDMFISLGTCEEEDFGLAVIEALQHNLKVILTRWGGYREFESVKGVALVDVKYKNKTLFIDENQLFNHILDAQDSSNHSMVNFNDLRKKQTIDYEDFIKFEGFQEAYRILKSTTFFNKEFFDHGEEFVSSMWL